jgi:hypothetical protein
MKSFCTLLYLALFPLASFALSTQDKDDFRSQLAIRVLEEKLALSAAREDFEPGAKAAALQDLSAQLTQAKIERNGYLNEGGGKRKLASISPDELSTAYPGNKTYSVFEWQVMAEHYGQPRQEEMLKRTFGLESLAPGEKGSGRVLWITSPSFPILSRAEQEKEKAERTKAMTRLRALGYEVEELATSPFIRMEDLADDLQKHLRPRLETGTPIFLISQGGASSVLLHTFDLYPELVSRAEILGWVNVNGRLYGTEPTKPRGPASLVKKPSAADRLLVETRNEELRLREERLERAAPLGAKFPVLNLITLSGSHRPATNLRESIVPEGKAYFLKAGSGLQELGSALPYLRNP